MVEVKDEMVLNYYVKSPTICRFHQGEKQLGGRTDSTFYLLSVGFKVRVIVAEFIKRPERCTSMGAL